MSALAECWVVANNLVLGFWTSSSIHGFSQGDYMGTYAALGVASGIFSFALSFSISQFSLTAGLRMFRTAFMAVVRSPISFFDTTPLGELHLHVGHVRIEQEFHRAGRIMFRLSKDQDTIDTELSMIATQVWCIRYPSTSAR